MKNRRIVMGLVACASLGMTATGYAQSGQPQSGAYQGVSQPPADAIETSPDAPPPPAAKPSAAVVASSQQNAPQPTSAGPVYPEPGPAQGQSYAPADDSQQGLNTRAAIVDPDGDMVHVAPARPGELLSGATIRVRLMERLSSAQIDKGQPFHGQVASDVLQDGKVLIPAGSNIEGKVTNVSTGHFGGHGSFRLRPEAVILPDGTRYELHAYTTGTPGSKARVGDEGDINPGSRAKKDGVEYGAVVGTGAVTGAVLGGPVGALTGSLIGAGMVTTHILVDHPQATLEPGAVLLFTLTEPMNLYAPGR
jgi:hypothetical protein